jgi:predicted nucleic acid-binding Zn ribbon protein
VRRLAPRPLGVAIEPVRRELAPATTLARIQDVWPRIAGAAEREASPISERSGTVTFACRSSVWAGELSLMSRELADRLNEALGDGSGERPVRELRFVTASSHSAS